MLRVVHFEIYADDPQRAADFYTKVFGWAISKWGEYDYWYMKTGDETAHGINGGIMKRAEPRQSREFAAFVCTIDVPDIDEYVSKIQEAHGAVVNPKSYVPGIGYMIHVADTEGNVFVLMQDEKK